MNAAVTSVRATGWCPLVAEVILVHHLQVGAPTYGMMNTFPLEKRCTGIEHHPQLFERLLPASEPEAGGRRPAPR